MQECRVLHLLDILGCDDARNKNSAGRHVAQSTVPGLCAKDAEEKGQSLVADGCFTLVRDLRDKRRTVMRGLQLFLEPGRFFGFARVAQEVIDISNAGSGKHALATDVPMLLLQVTQEFDLHADRKSTRLN